MKKLFYGGTILTMASPPTAPALLVEGGRILALGDRQSLAAQAPDAVPCFLAGAVLLPAFIDAHSHLTALAATLGAVPLGAAVSFAEIERRIAAYIHENNVPPGEWVVGFGYDQNSLREGRHPGKGLLDRAAPKNPVIISHASGHMGVLNCAALKAMGIGADTPDPPGGRIGRMEGGGEPSGYLEETAFTANTAKMPAPSPEQQERKLLAAQKVYLSHGITTIQDGFTKAGELGQLLWAAEAGRLLADVVCYVDIKDNRGLRAAHPGLCGQYRHRLKLGGYKIFLDGSPQGRTAWMSAPYADAADGYRGYGTYRDEEVRQLVGEALADGAQLLTHCNGDAAAEQLICAMEAAKGVGGDVAALRPVMIHAQLVRRDQLPRMAALGMVASFFTAHSYYWGDVHLKNFGPARGGAISPARSALEDGVVYTFHQDTPVIAPDMLETIGCAVRRVTRAGVQLDKGECLTPLQALRAVTVNAAYQYFEEGEKGSLSPGKRADLVALSGDPLSAAPAGIKDIRVLKTWKEGEEVYSC